MKKFFKFFLLCVTVMLCVFGTTACTNNSEDKTVTVQQLIEANDRQKVIDKYGNLHVKEISTYDTGSIYNANALIYANDYGFVMDYLDEKTDGSSIYSTTFINGISYTFEKIGDYEYYAASLIKDDEYNDTIDLFFNF
ncbi:MAG: hypothetical protein ACI35W_00615 [Anaeroplasmataceae bacterium]